MKESYTLEELVKYLRENPDAEFTTTDSNANKYLAKMTPDGKLYFYNSTHYSRESNISIHLTWKLKTIPKQVTFLEAMKAFYDGKTISVSMNTDFMSNLTDIYTRKGSNLEILDKKGRAISVMEILDGLWFIGDVLA